MSKRKIALGPGAASLILIVVALSLCMLAMLAQIGARSDYNLAARSAEMVTRVYELRDHSEQRMAELDAVLVRCGAEKQDREAYLAAVKENLPEGMTLNGNIVSWTEPLNNRTMNCEAEILEPDGIPRAKWITYKLKVDEPEDDWEW